MQNLLPQLAQETIRTGYARRRVIILSFVMFFACLVGVVALLPSFFIIESRVETLSGTNTVTAEHVVSQEKILTIPDKFNILSRTVLSFKQTEKVSEKINAIEVSRVSGIVLDAVSYAPRKGGADAKIIRVSGIARDRATLLAFEKSLESLEFVSDVSVPVEHFAKDSNLPFTLSINLK